MKRALILLVVLAAGFALPLVGWQAVDPGQTEDAEETGFGPVLWKALHDAQAEWSLERVNQGCRQAVSRARAGR